MPDWPWSVWLMVAWYTIGLPFLGWCWWSGKFDERRRKPEDYVGKFRRPDGSIVHVARMPGGQLWAADDHQPPGPIGYVTGRDVVGWEKLGAHPDD